MSSVVITGMKLDRPTRPTNLLLAVLLVIALAAVRINVTAAALVGILLVLMIVWRLDGLGAPIEVEAFDIDFDARVIRCVGPGAVVPFVEVLEPILVEGGEGSSVWRVRLSRASGDGKPLNYLLVTETAPLGPLSGTGIQVESVEYPPPVI